MNGWNADTSWMRGSFGLSVHWTSKTVCLNGTSIPYSEAVDCFDPGRFAGDLAAAGAKHCIFTLTHGEQYLALPHPLLDKLLPGRTAKRDLIGELIVALAKYRIRFIAYYNHSCNGTGDPAWKKACGYADGIHGNLDGFAENICGIVAYIARRYGSGIAGWWFDSSYSVDPRGPHNTVSCEMGGWRFPWKALADAAKSGHRDCAVTFNAGVGSRFLYAPCQDYYAGEAVRLDEPFVPDAVSGMRDHRWICADSPDWLLSAKNCAGGFAPPRFSVQEMRDFLKEHREAGRMVTFNLQIDQEGILNPSVLDAVKRMDS